MFKLQVEEEDYAFKPMNCPESTLVFRFKTRSYRDLPLRLAQTDRLLRNERSGTLNGLLRVRQLTMDDAHIFCRPDQVQDEIRGVLEFQKAIYDVFGLEPRYYLSTRPEKAIGEPAVWDAAEADLKAALELNGLAYEVKAGEGAFYGPKIDVDIQDALGRPWQLNTTQLDFQMPERFKLEYVGEDGQAHRPVMIHRAIFGTYERFMAVLIEHYAGAFPLWLAPVQAVDRADRRPPPRVRRVGSQPAASKPASASKSTRAARRCRPRSATPRRQQVPYMLVVGDRDQEAGTVSVRERRQGDLGPQPVADFLKLLEDRSAPREPSPSPTDRYACQVTMPTRRAPRTARSGRRAARCVRACRRWSRHVLGPSGCTHSWPRNQASSLVGLFVGLRRALDELDLEQAIRGQATAPETRATTAARRARRRGRRATAGPPRWAAAGRAGPPRRSAARPLPSHPGTARCPRRRSRDGRSATTSAARPVGDRLASGRRRRGCCRSRAPPCRRAARAACPPTDRPR